LRAIVGLHKIDYPKLILHKQCITFTFENGVIRIKRPRGHPILKLPCPGGFKPRKSKFHFDTTEVQDSMAYRNGLNFRYKGDKHTIFTQLYEEDEFVIGVRKLTDVDAVKFAIDDIEHVIYENGTWMTIVELINASDDNIRI
jgi:hypothetical protein